MTSRHRMDGQDWLNAVFNVAIGLFLGLALNGLAQLVWVGAWSLVVILLTFCGCLALILFLFDGLTGGWLDRLFSSGVRPAARPMAQGRRPLMRLVSLPAGMALGVILAQLGLTQTIVNLL